jgi:hypothetical protein
LQLHPEKTHLVDMKPKALSGLTLSGTAGGPARRASEAQGRGAPEDRAHPRPRLAVIIADNRTLQGWFGYFKHSHGSFSSLDAWIRQRFCAHVRRRARGPDFQRWAQLLCGATEAHASYSPLSGETGEPDAGEPPVRFGGCAKPIAYPYPNQTRQQRLLGGLRLVYPGRLSSMLRVGVAGWRPHDVVLARAPAPETASAPSR